MSKVKSRIFLAIGIKGMEEFLKKQLGKEYEFVGEAIYRERVLINALQCNPDIIVLRETLNGSKNILEIVYDLRLQLPDARIIFLASDRKPGDSLLAELVGNGVYDFMTGNRVSAPDVITLIREPNKFSDVAMYRPKYTVNEKTNETLFEAPPVKEVVKQVKQTVYVEKETADLPILPPNFQQGETESEGTKGSNEEIAADKTPKKSRRRFLKPKGKSEPTPNPDPTPAVEQEPLVIPVEIEVPEVEVIPPPVDPFPIFTPDIEPPALELKPTTEPNPQPVENPTPKPPVEEVVLPPVEPVVEPVEEPISPPTPSKKGEKQARALEDMFNPQNGKQKILTFVGGEHGVGNSQVAFNTALNLGKRGFKTIFIELKEQGSTIEYLYQLAMVDKGLDVALQSLVEESFAGLENSIVRIEEVRSKSNSAIMAESYKQFPTNLDFLFFSPDYVLETDVEKKRIEPSLLKELCMHLFFQAGYHYIVLDADPYLFNAFSEVALGFGTHVFYTVTQDVCHIGRAVRNIAEANKRINVTNKLYYIVNKFEENTDLSKKDIEDWLKAEVATIIPIRHKDFINANMNGQPVLLYSKDKNLKKAFDQMVEHILSK